MAGNAICVLGLKSLGEQPAVAEPTAGRNASCDALQLRSHGGPFMLQRA